MGYKLKNMQTRLRGFFRESNKHPHRHLLHPWLWILPAIPFEQGISSGILASFGETQRQIHFVIPFRLVENL
jgi:hypothetical protein